MLQKLQQYSDIVCSPLAHLVKLVDLRYSTNFIRDAYVLRRYVQLPSAAEYENSLHLATVRQVVKVIYQVNVTVSVQ